MVQATTAFEKRLKEGMRRGSEIAVQLRRMYWPKTTMAQRDDIIGLLKRAKVRFVLMGAYAMNGWRDEPRASQDVVVLVQARDHAEAIEVLTRRYSQLRVVDHPVVTRFNGLGFEICGHGVAESCS